MKQCLLEDGDYEEKDLEVVIDLVMQLGDSNNDGKLSYLEFLEMLGKPDVDL